MPKRPRQRISQSSPPGPQIVMLHPPAAAGDADATLDRLAAALGRMAARRWIRAGGPGAIGIDTAAESPEP